jgi:hypothetical protein
MHERLAPAAPAAPASRRRAGTAGAARGAACRAYQLAVIDDFLTRARQLTAAYASALSGRHAAASRQPPTG